MISFFIFQFIYLFLFLSPSSRHPLASSCHPLVILLPSSPCPLPFHLMTSSPCPPNTLLMFWVNQLKIWYLRLSLHLFLSELILIEHTKCPTDVLQIRLYCTSRPVRKSGKFSKSWTVRKPYVFPPGTFNFFRNRNKNPNFFSIIFSRIFLFIYLV